MSTTEENKAVSNRSAELISQHDFDNFEEVMATSDLEWFKSTLASILVSFPDFQVENTEQIAEGNKVVNRAIVRCTHQGEFMGVAPTGKRVTVNVISIDTIKDGKVVDSWVMFDWLSLLQQIGVTSVPPSTPA